MSARKGRQRGVVDTCSIDYYEVMKALAVAAVSENQQNEGAALRPGALRFVTWFLPALALCVVLARVAVHVQSFWAPLGVFSLLVGATLGAVIVGLVLLSGSQRRQTLFAGTLFLSVVTVVSEHYFFFRTETLNRQATIETAKAKNPAVQAVHMPPPELGPAGFVQFVRNKAAPSRIAIWVLDALLVALGATITVALAVRSSHPAEQKVLLSEAT